MGFYKVLLLKMKMDSFVKKIVEELVLFLCFYFE